ncbi:MAG: ribosome small subunit-dependent GTPase A [Lachnospirales bacterium]
MNIGRIIKGVGGLYYIAAYGCVYECSARGKFRKAKIVPTVGDFVEFTILDENNKKGAIDKIQPRKNYLIRPRVTNIDTAIITFAAASPDINYDLLDKFLILAEYQKIPNIIICINKSDLASNEKIDYLKRVYSSYKLIFSSAIEGSGIEEIKESIKGGVAVFAGPSGVGKSSLINSLIPQSNRATGEISRKIERGKHTTREVELLEAFEDTFIVDSPGFTSLSLDFVKIEDLPNFFREFKPYLDNSCFYNDCVHINEPDCNIKNHIDNGIPLERYERYKNLYDEFKKRR